nr:hypothetical protein [Streptococcus salivarius]
MITIRQFHRHNIRRTVFISNRYRSIAINRIRLNTVGNLWIQGRHSRNNLAFICIC